MNEKFFSLPEEKQHAIINAGYRVFSQNSYKKSPMSEIADAAGISKSLLFHYFGNKQELYLFLWNKCAEVTEEYLQKYCCYEQKDMFWASEGYVWELARQGNVDADQMKQEFGRLIEFWKKIYIRKEEAYGCD